MRRQKELALVELTHETEGEFGITTNSVVDFDVVRLVLADHHGVSAVQREFKVVLQDNRNGDRLTELMRSLSGSGGLCMS